MTKIQLILKFQSSFHYLYSFLITFILKSEKYFFYNETNENNFNETPFFSQKIPTAFFYQLKIYFEMYRTKYDSRKQAKQGSSDGSAHGTSGQVKKRRFTQEEDELIKKLVEEKKCSSWEEVAKHVPGRTGCQCRDRYNSYLFKETQNTKRWTEEEDQLLIQKYKEYGPHWVKISQFFNGRTGNQIKNRWHKSLVQYHGIEHNLVKQERRSKKVKFQIQDNQPPKPEPTVQATVKNPEIMQAFNIPESIFTDFFDEFSQNFFATLNFEM